MKSSIKYLFISLIAVALLAGCTNPLAGLNKTDKNISEVVIVEDSGMSEMEEMEAEEPMKDYSCDMLTSESGKVNCTQMINDMIAEELSNEISRTFDIKRCDELDGYRVENCKSRIENTGVTGPVSEDEIQDYQNAMNMTYPELTGEEDEEMEGGVGYYELTKCAALKAPGYKVYCEKRLGERIDEEKLWKIIEGGDVSECDTLTSGDMREMCKMEFGVYPEEEEMMEEEVMEDVVEEIVAE